MTNAMPILLDRLSDALCAQGVNLKRQDLLKVATAAFGYRDDNAFSVCMKTEGFAPPVAEMLGCDDRGLAVLRDPRADAVFAMDVRDPRSRAGRWCVSPYGGLLDIAGVPATTDMPRTAIKIHIATISHRHGINFYTALTQQALDAEVAGFCDEWWSEARQNDEELPETTEGMSDADVASAYFAAMDDEYIEESTDTLSLPASMAKAFETSTGEAWIIGRGGEGQEAMTWWSDADGWGDMASATVHAEPSGRLPVTGLQEGRDRISWHRLPAAHVVAPASIEQPGWETADGTDAEVAAGVALSINPIQAAPGLSFDRLEVLHRRDEAASRGYMKSVVLRASDGEDREAGDEWARQVSSAIDHACGVIKRKDGETYVTFFGDAGISEADTAQDWLRATADLLQPVEGRERIMADFRPEAWINDNAVEVDSDKPNKIDVTYEMLLMGREAAMELGSEDSDHLLEAVRSPRWIRQWSGPFTVSVHGAVTRSGLFEVE